MTGETEKGRSISVVRKALPLNSNLAIAQAAEMPKTRLSGTEIAATSSVRRIAERVSGSASASRVGADALGQRLVEDDDQRQEQEDAEEGEGHRHQQPPAPAGFRSPPPTGFRDAARRI